MSDTKSLEGVRPVLSAVENLTDAAIARAAELTRRGKDIDDYQVLAERVSYAATEARAARALYEFADSRPKSTPALTLAAITGVAQLAAAVRTRLDPCIDELGLGEAALEQHYSAPVRAAMRSAMSERSLRELGRLTAEVRGRNTVPLESTLEQVRDSVRSFADKEVEPHAERIHVHDELVPAKFITEMSELGYFGLSVPEQYGGHEMGNLAMILTTEELSRASLAGAGSLITRPEILAKALIAGGTDEQKKYWLPKIANGELMVAISVTEPDTGSDVASLSCKAERATVDGVEGWQITGAKSWCTFAGRADIVALLARTDPDVSKGAKGLSIFIVPKQSFDGHEFRMEQPSGGIMEGKADRTPGYRGMHSFTLNLDKYFVPAANLVGQEAGLGRGFYLQMAGFAAGRLQTGGRACGLAQAALERTANYVTERKQFRRTIGDFQLTQYNLGQMASKLAAARAITYAAAEAMDENERAASTLAAQAKLYACDVAVEVTQLGQLLHGGWGYAEEYPISRYVVDAQVLPIFEGVKPVLELKVIARSLFSSAN